MRSPTLKVAWLLLLPALAIGQIPDPLPVRHDSVDVHDTAPEVQESSPATTVKPAEVKDLPSRPATVNDALPLLPGIVRSPNGGLRINSSGEQRHTLAYRQLGGGHVAAHVAARHIHVHIAVEHAVFVAAWKGPSPASTSRSRPAGSASCHP